MLRTANARQPAAGLSTLVLRLDSLPAQVGAVEVVVKSKFSRPASFWMGRGPSMVRPRLAGTGDNGDIISEQKNLQIPTGR